MRNAIAVGFAAVLGTGIVALVTRPSSRPPVNPAAIGSNQMALPSAAPPATELVSSAAQARPAAAPTSAQVLRAGQAPDGGGQEPGSAEAVRQKLVEIRAYPRIQACVAEMAPNPGISELELLFDAQGVAKQISAEGALRSCVLDALRDFRYPVPSGDDPAMYSVILPLGGGEP